MVRSCKHHVEYVEDSDCVTCQLHHVVNVRTCSACKDFELLRIEKPPRPSGRTITRKPWRGSIGSRLAAIIHRETGSEVSCAECDSDLARMNLMSRDAVIEEMQILAERIVDRGKTRAEAWWQKAYCRIAPSLAVERVRGWITEAVCGPPVEPNRGAWRSDIRHLTFHMYPLKQNDSWKWNLQQLAARWELFNGKRICAIAFDDATEDPDSVIEYAESVGVAFDHFVIEPNKTMIREVVTWVPMLEQLLSESAGTDEVVFSSHAKGVTRGETGNMTRHWADLMYQSCLDSWPLVQKHLSQHVMTGSFRRFGEFATPGNNRWHYSGTFYWWRLAEIAKRNWRKVDQRFFGTESWPGHMCLPEETGCLFLDDAGDPYSEEYWNQTVWPAWKEFSDQQGLKT